MEGSLSISCKKCQGKYYPRSFDSKYFSFCVYETQLIDFREGLTETNLLNLENCSSFRFVGSDKECVYCVQENAKKFIRGNFCAEECFSDEVAFRFYFEEKGTRPYAFMKCIRQNQIVINKQFSLENCKILDYDVSVVRTGVTTEDQIPKGCV